MNCECPNCGSTMEFSPALRKMYCTHCGVSQPVSARRDVNRIIPFQTDEDECTENEKSTKEKQDWRRHAVIKMQIAHCTECGADLGLNDLELSSFCPYCGQATIVKDRIADFYEPDTIIPFKITKEKAADLLRDYFACGKYIPDELKDFEFERLRGIYVPYWVADLYYTDDQYWKTWLEYKEVIGYRHVEAEGYFRNLTMDASRRIDDEFSRRLEPFDMEGRAPFHASFLSGFYADCCDVGSEEIKIVAKARAKEIFDEKMRWVGGRDLPVETRPQCRIESLEYVLLPIWFMTTHWKGRPITVMINGQTGKVAGSVPIDRKKWFRDVGISVSKWGLSCAFFLGVFSWALAITTVNLWFFLFFIVGVILPAPKIKRDYRQLMQRISMSESRTIYRYSKNRRSKNGND